MAKMNFNRDFALAGEIIRYHKFSFSAIILHEHDDLISCKYFMTFNENFE